MDKRKCYIWYIKLKVTSAATTWIKLYWEKTEFQKNVKNHIPYKFLLSVRQMREKRNCIMTTRHAKHEKIRTVTTTVLRLSAFQNNSKNVFKWKNMTTQNDKTPSLPKKHKHIMICAQKIKFDIPITSNSCSINKNPKKYPISQKTTKPQENATVEIFFS